MKKDYGKYILYGLLAVVIVVAIFAFTGFPGNIYKKTANPGASINQEKDTLSRYKSTVTGDTGPGGVSVELTPNAVSNGQLRVGISVNTHSVDLGQFDLKQITTLEYNGKLIKLVSAPSLGGHHSNGELIFEVDEDVESFSIKIIGIPKVEERVFEWY